MVFVLSDSPQIDLAPSWYVVSDGENAMLCEIGSHWRLLAKAELPDSLSQPLALSSPIFLGYINGEAVAATRLADDPPEGFEWRSLRSLLGKIEHDKFQLAGRALQLQRWSQDHRYCGACGSPTAEASNDRSRVCPQCEKRYYPRISPCVIGLITRGRECLLARGPRHPEGMYSTLAGFIEPGENGEQAFAREVMEEVGVCVHNVKYQCSQAWPFPGQFMVGYHADYLSGDIKVDGVEIIEAAWYAVDALPHFPPAGTISHQLIEMFIASMQNSEADEHV